MNILLIEKIPEHVCNKLIWDINIALMRNKTLSKFTVQEPDLVERVNQIRIDYHEAKVVENHLANGGSAQTVTEAEKPKHPAVIYLATKTEELKSEIDALTNKVTNRMSDGKFIHAKPSLITKYQTFCIRTLRCAFKNDTDMPVIDKDITRLAFLSKLNTLNEQLKALDADKVLLTALEKEVCKTKKQTFLSRFLEQKEALKEILNGNDIKPSQSMSLLNNLDKHTLCLQGTRNSVTINYH